MGTRITKMKRSRADKRNRALARQMEFIKSALEDEEVAPSQSTEEGGPTVEEMYLPAVLPVVEVEIATRGEMATENLEEAVAPEQQPPMCPDHSAAEKELSELGATRDKTASIISKSGIVSLSPLERLPHELIWKLIDFVPESSFELGLTSRTMQSRVDKYAHNRVGIPIVKSMSIARTHDNFEYGKEYEFKFSSMEDQGWLDDLALCIGTKIKKVEINPRRIALKWRKNELQELAMYSKILEGKEIGRLNLCMASLSEDAINHLLKPVASIRKLAVVWNITTEEVGIPFLECIEQRGVEEITLYMHKTLIADPAKFLLDLSSLVRVMHIHQNAVRGITGNEYFFGLINFDWAPTILNMLSRKLDKLCIENQDYDEYLSEDSVRCLRERLPLIGKHIWFAATCSYISEEKSLFDYQENGFIVRAPAEDGWREGEIPDPQCPDSMAGDDENLPYHSLAIVHLSRVEEGFDMPTYL